MENLFSNKLIMLESYLNWKTSLYTLRDVTCQDKFLQSITDDSNLTDLTMTYQRHKPSLRWLTTGLEESVQSQ
jgi:hypothetical protein